MPQGAAAATSSIDLTGGPFLVLAPGQIGAALPGWGTNASGEVAPADGTGQLITLSGVRGDCAAGGVASGYPNGKLYLRCVV